ncbi:FecR family protein [Zhouia amylolytica]|uniref:FecR family protein n=1 Tax=Zhouia amylolytica AD3 TaxID=1286632 RepID=W2USI9_9FLAO|nr:FecR domain-containing protein [Zhouia amylolytica]ETN96934.1 hypothetical protein P278_03600 [Zhouia amylolytica AD3]
MMTKKRMKIIITKFINNEASYSEIRDLSAWLDEEGNQKVFKDYLSINYSLKKDMVFDSLKAYEATMNNIKSKKYSRKFLVQKFYRYAALVAIVITAGYFSINTYYANRSKLTVDEKHVTLLLDNGEIRILNENIEEHLVDKQGNVLGVQNKDQLMYNSNQGQESLLFNTLTVPYGKKFEVTLSDGTVINLNSGSTLRYPVKFIEGKDRKVYLQGEGFFNVAEDKNHPFIVNTNQVDVRVLGTQFNMSSYEEDLNIKTVLLEGSICLYHKDSIYNHESSIILKPGLMAIWERATNQVNLNEADTELYTAWLHGELVFRHMPFESIIKKLERHYNVEIINNNQKIGSEKFTARFDTETIEKVMNSFRVNYNIDFVIENNKIIIQ